MTGPQDSLAGPYAPGTRVEVFTDADGDHVGLLIDGVTAAGSLFTSRSLDPKNPAVWLDGRRLYGVDLYWNTVYQFSVPQETFAGRPTSEEAESELSP